MLDFDADTHRYRLDGVAVPSVTTILTLANLDGMADVPVEWLEDAALRGHAVHLACELWDEGTLDETALDPRLAARLAAYQRFRAETRWDLEFVELPVASRVYRFAGRPDRTFWLSATERGVVDLKSGPVGDAAKLQLGAYAVALQETWGRPYRRFALELRDTGDYRLHPEFTDRHDVHDFLAAVRVAHRIVRQGRAEAILRRAT